MYAYHFSWGISDEFCFSMLGLCSSSVAFLFEFFFDGLFGFQQFFFLFFFAGYFPCCCCCSSLQLQSIGAFWACIDDCFIWTMSNDQIVSKAAVCSHLQWKRRAGEASLLAEQRNKAIENKTWKHIECKKLYAYSKAGTWTIHWKAEEYAQKTRG